MGNLDERANIERVARALASSAGLVWDHMEKYPGYSRGIWVAKARQLLSGMNGDARVRV